MLVQKSSDCYKPQHIIGDMMFFVFKINYGTFYTHSWNQNIKQPHVTNLTQNNKLLVFEH
jgi:hypothetical protein